MCIVTGFVCINYPELMLEKEAKELYLSWLAKDTPLKLKLQVLLRVCGLGGCV